MWVTTVKVAVKDIGGCICCKSCERCKEHKLCGREEDHYEYKKRVIEVERKGSRFIPKGAPFKRIGLREYEIEPLSPIEILLDGI